MDSIRFFGRTFGIMLVMVTICLATKMFSGNETTLYLLVGGLSGSLGLSLIRACIRW